LSLRALAVLLLLVAAPAQAQDEQERLERMREQIEARESRARELSDEADGYLDELDAIDRDLTDARDQLRRLRVRQSDARRELDGADRALAVVEATLSETRALVGRRLVALYKYRSTGGFTALYSAQDFQRVARRGRGLAQVLDADARLFGRYRDVLAEHTAARDARAGRVSSLDRARAAADQREEDVRHQLVERRNVVALLKSRADRERREAAELREAAERLEATLARLPRGGARAGDGLSKGMLAWPVQGEVRLGFGRQIDPQFGTATLRNGVEIEAPEGTPVRAVGPGKVLFAGWFRGYGQMVIIDHGEDHVTVSGYLDQVAARTDQYVRRGEVIGSVGETGSLSGPGLYFEIRLGGRPVDPRPWFE